MKQSVAILDFGTSKITVLIGSRGINNSICIDGTGVCDYAGFSGGEWLAPDKLANAVTQAIAIAESSARLKINKLYVGVPGDFSVCKVNDVTMSVNKKRRITDRDVEALHSQGNEYFSDPNWTVINIQPIYYTLDDDRKLIAPIGMVSTRLGGSISYMLAKNEFIDLVDSAVGSAGIPETEYVSAPLAEMLFLFDEYKRDNYVLCADVGALGTTLVLGRGDGICRQYFFPWGGERITFAISEELEIPLGEAELLKRKVILSLDPHFAPPSDEPDIATGDAHRFLQTEYTVETNHGTHTYDVEKTNEIVRNEIGRFSRYLNKALKTYCDYEFPEFTPLSVTGGGLNYIRGASEYLSECLGREVELVKPNLPLFERPQQSSALGLMDMVLSCETAYSGVVDKFKRLFSGRR